MKNSAFILLISVVTATCFAQTKKVGGPCEGCEAIYESPIPFEQLKAFTLLPGTTWDGKNPLGINGIVYKADGKNPAPGVVLYFYHTDETGYYPKKGNEKGWGKRHGYIRGWVRTMKKANTNLAPFALLLIRRDHNLLIFTLP